jgi:hypothetical protein
MLRSTFCALQVDAGRRLIWITPCKPQAQLGVETAPSLPELRSSSTHYGVEGEICTSYPELRFACTGLSKSDAFRRQLAMHKYTSYATSVNKINRRSFGLFYLFLSSLIFSLKSKFYKL